MIFPQSYDFWWAWLNDFECLRFAVPREVDKTTAGQVQTAP